MSKEEEVLYLIPETNIMISQAWLNLITHCQDSFPYGDMTVRIVNAQPTELIDEKPKIRFDKKATIPKLPITTNA